MISIKGLNAGYGGKTVLKGVDLDMPEGTVSGLMGINGAGKTTLLDCIAGFLRVDRSRILENGLPLDRRKIAYLENANFFYRGMTGREYLMLLAGRREGPAIEELNALFGLPLDSTVETYSAGMKKKLALGGVILRRKAFILMDEPFNGLDTESVFLLKKIIVRLGREGATVLVTSHIPETLTPVCDFIHVLDGGRITATFAKDDFHSLAAYIDKGLDEKYGELPAGIF